MSSNDALSDRELLVEIKKHLKQKDREFYEASWAAPIAFGFALMMPAASVYLKLEDYALGWALIGFAVIVYSIIKVFKLGSSSKSNRNLSS